MWFPTPRCIRCRYPPAGGGSWRFVPGWKHFRFWRLYKMCPCLHLNGGFLYWQTDKANDHFPPIVQNVTQAAIGDPHAGNARRIFKKTIPLLSQNRRHSCIHARWLGFCNHKEKGRRLLRVLFAFGWEEIKPVDGGGGTPSPSSGFRPIVPKSLARGLQSGRL